MKIEKYKNSQYIRRLSRSPGSFEVSDGPKSFSHQLVYDYSIQYMFEVCCYLHQFGFVIMGPAVNNRFINIIGSNSSLPQPLHSGLKPELVKNENFDSPILLADPLLLVVAQNM